MRKKRLRTAIWKPIGPFSTTIRADKPKEPAAKRRPPPSTTGKPTIANAPSPSAVARLAPAEAFLIPGRPLPASTATSGPPYLRVMEGVSGTVRGRGDAREPAHASAHGAIKKTPMRVERMDGPRETNQNPTRTD